MPTDQDRSRALPTLVPGGLYLTGEDHLQLSVLVNGTATLIVTGRVLTPEGRVVPYRDRRTVTATRSAATTYTLALVEGWLLSVRAITAVNSWQISEVFVRAEIVRGFTGGQEVLETVLQGSLSGGQVLAWPGSPLRSSVDGPGALFSLTGTDPAVGVEISETVPTGARWRLHAWFATFACSAIVGSREVRLVIDDGATILADSFSGLAQQANQTYGYTAGDRGYSRDAASIPRMMLPLVPPLLRAGYRVRTVVQNLDPGDNWSAPQMLVEEWLEAQ